MKVARETPSYLFNERGRRYLKESRWERWYPTREQAEAHLAAQKQKSAERQQRHLAEAASPDMLAALKTAEKFIAAELEQRRGSFLPNPTEDEQGYIAEAEDALATVRAALAKAEGRQ